MKRYCGLRMFSGIIRFLNTNRNDKSEKSFRSRIAFSLIEVLSGLMLAVFLFFIMYKFWGWTRFHYMYGTVNLQNLHGAQMVINYLRRDFSSSSPMISSKDDYLTREKIRRKIFNVVAPPANSKAIDIDPGGKKLNFFRFVFDTNIMNGVPKTEKVEYSFDTQKRILKRITPTRTIEFDGLDDVVFKVYVHELNPNIPILWVRFVVNEGKGIGYAGGKEVGKPLEITTSISSSFITSNINNLSWHYETCHE
ncbi:MAG: hypothetical protein HQM10_21025 [Candidatus Riflebacteria bacterium]|nr:hypothetical protein [Candidatus Riflebacteria bacterium]